MLASIPASNSAEPVRSGFWRGFARNRAAVIGLVLVLIVIAMALLAPYLSDNGPWDMVQRPYLWPGDAPGFLLGTDTLGRDLFAGLLYGARVSLMIGLVATATAVLIGTVVGAIAGYFGGWTDTILMRLTEIIQTMPPMILAIVIVAVFTPTVTTVMLAIATISWPAIARLVRGETLRLRNTEFVQSCLALGMNDARIILTQILPNCLAPVVVTASVMVSSAILIEAGLAFLGLSDPDMMSWGLMIATGREALRTAWYIVTIPGLAILFTVLGLNLLGDGLNDALNPRLKER
ncbi:MAG: ABC transporter permease [Pseudomonadota bacterium]